MVWTLVPMAVSGYLIQVVAAPGWVRGLVVVHVGTGVLFVAGLAGHAVALVLRRVRRRAGSSAYSATPADGASGS